MQIKRINFIKTVSYQTILISIPIKCCFKTWHQWQPAYYQLPFRITNFSLLLQQLSCTQLSINRSDSKDYQLFIIFSQILVSIFFLYIIQSKMKEFNLTEIFASVSKCQFSRKCSNSEVILNKLAEDFIMRYSQKNQPHPDFFKEDIAMTRNQLILYADECVQVMRKFEFLQKGAEIVKGVTNSAFKINDFLSKQLYHLLQNRPPKIVVTQQPLCSACGKLRQNEKVRSMKQQLDTNTMIWGEKKMHREMTQRNGQKYDEEELMEEQMDILDSRSEEIIRKKLEKMELDHNKRKNEMTICLEQLNRANQRVMSYDKLIKRNDKQDTDRFNIKDYVFKLGRHFQHNISSLQYKIKQLKHTIIHIENQSTQTESKLIPLQQHLKETQTLNSQIASLKILVSESLSSQTINKRKSNQLQQTVLLLRTKLQQLSMSKQKQIIEGKLQIMQLEINLKNCQLQIQTQESLLKKLKGSKLKDPEDENIPIKEECEEVETSNKEIDLSSSKNSEDADPNNDRNQNFKHAKRNKSFYKQPVLISQRTFKQSKNIISNLSFIDQIKENSQFEENSDMRFKPSNKMAICSVFSETYQLVSTNQFNNLYNYEAEKQIMANQFEQVGFNYKNKLRCSEKPFQRERIKKMSKIDIKMLQSFRQKYNLQASSYKGTQSPDLPKNIISEQSTSAYDLLNTIKVKPQLTRTKTLSKDIKRLQRIQLPYFNRQSILEKQNKKKESIGSIYEKKQNNKRKKRYLSQENSCEQLQYLQMKRSIQKIDNKQKGFFGIKERQLLFSIYQNEFKTTKYSFNRKDGGRSILSLEQISYSTYFYSLLAKLHLKNEALYETVRRFMCTLQPGLGDDETSMKQSLNYILIAHRRCSNGSICQHLEQFLERIRNL